MPELPEVETVCRGLRETLTGRRLTRVVRRRADLRKPFPKAFARRLGGSRVREIGRRGKYILVRFEGDLVLILHLGMSGRLLIGPDSACALGPHDHVVFHTDDGQRIVFRDPRRFGLMDLAPAERLDGHPLLRELGPEPLDPGFTPALLAARLAGRKTPIKAALLDQRIVAGLGNIYACEALFRARLSPRRRAASVAGRRAERLAAAIRGVLVEAIDAGGSSLRDYVRTDGELGYFQHRFAVYDREGDGCPGCACRTGVLRIGQGGRSTFYCPLHQR